TISTTSGRTPGPATGTSPPWPPCPSAWTVPTRSTTTTTSPGTSGSRGRCGGEKTSMIDFQVLVITLALRLCIVALTTVAAIANKIYSNREEDSKRAFLTHLRKQFLLLSIPEEKERALREIGA